MNLSTCLEGLEKCIKISVDNLLSQLRFKPQPKCKSRTLAFYPVTLGTDENHFHINICRSQAQGLCTLNKPLPCNIVITLLQLDNKTWSSDITYFSKSSSYANCAQRTLTNMLITKLAMKNTIF
jgi:hypothetical protein